MTMDETTNTVLVLLLAFAAVLLVTAIVWGLTHQQTADAREEYCPDCWREYRQTHEYTKTPDWLDLEPVYCPLHALFREYGLADRLLPAVDVPPYDHGAYAEEEDVDERGRWS